MVNISSLSVAANELRVRLQEGIDGIEIDQIKIGHPKDTFEEIDKHKDKNHINLFFYNVQYDGYPADGTNDDPFYIRLYCLITAVGAKIGNPSPGENDLRLIGEIMRVLHGQPIIIVSDEQDEEIAHLQVIPHPLNLDNLNHIWSTQGETAYRLSVAYEMSLAPIPLTMATNKSPSVGQPLIHSNATTVYTPSDVHGKLVNAKPIVQYLEIDTDKDDWVPHICYVEHIDASAMELHYVFSISGDLSEEQDIFIAGKNNGIVRMSWKIWRRKTDNSIVAWEEDIPDVVEPLEKEIKDQPITGKPFTPNRIDPDDIDTRRIFQVKLPAEIASNDTKTWQAMLCAVHEWQHEEPVGSGEFVITQLMSNQILLYGEAS